MTVPGNSALILVLTLSILVSSAYAVGRIHEWHRHGLKRDEAYRHGYEKASISMIGIMNAGSPPNAAHTARFGTHANTRTIGRHARGRAASTHVPAATSASTSSPTTLTLRRRA